MTSATVLLATGVAVPAARPGVRENRGAGPGRTIPSTGASVERADERRVDAEDVVGSQAETLRDTRPVHPHHVSAEFAQQHRGKRTGPDSGELHYPDPGERPVKGRRH
jgi:hypothetical protein